MKDIPNLLLIAGTGRNTGKTTLACSIIDKFSSKYQIVGLKISPHFHGGTNSLQEIITNKNFNIYKETSSTTGKDSSLMLKARAEKVFYIEVLDDYLEEAFTQFLKILPERYLLVCESPALRNYIHPGVFLIVDSENNKNKKTEILKWKKVADKWINIDVDNLLQIIEKIQVFENEWKFIH